MNLYTYCHNDPINFVDPSGHWEIGDEKLSKSAQKKIKKSIKKDSKNNKYIDAETWKQVSRETSRQTRGEAQYAQKAAVNVISYIEKEVGVMEIIRLTSKNIQSGSEGAI